MKILGVIPARFASTRFPGKPLALIEGIPMLQWVVEAVQKAHVISHLVVATDDERIEELCGKIGVDCEMTDSNLPTGSDRAWAVAKNRDCDVVVNIQGDEPLLNSDHLEALVRPLEKSLDLQMSTLARQCLQVDLENINSAKVLVDKNQQAIYFSRLGIPYTRNSPTASSVTGALEGVLCHIGLYAYRKEFLGEYCEFGTCLMENAEGLEQLRALYMGAKIYVAQVNGDSHGVDVPADIKKIEMLLNGRIDRA